MRISAAWTSIVIIGLSAHAIADEPTSPDDSADTRPRAEARTDALPPAESLSNWLLDDGDLVQTGAYSTNRVSTLDSLDFREFTAIERLGKYRSLSLVTFAEVGKARLFLGVNEDGLLGLHLNSRPKRADETTVEVVRMPYLEAREPDEAGE